MPAPEEDCEPTGRLRRDLLLDVRDFLLEALMTLVKTLVAYLILKNFTDLEENSAIEVAALLGFADFFTRSRSLRSTRDVRDRISVTRDGSKYTVSEEHREVTSSGGRRTETERDREYAGDDSAR